MSVAHQHSLPGAPRQPDLTAAGALARARVASGDLPCAVLGVSDATRTLRIDAIPGPADPGVTADSVFFLASVTKPIVAAAAMQLVDEGRLDLDAPIARYLSAYRGGQRELVTARHVLTHTSGVPDRPLEELVRDRPSFQRLVAWVLAAEPAFEPGSRYAYASDSFLLLAAVVGVLTGMPFAVALDRRLLTPLGMRSTSFDARSMRDRTQTVHGVRLDNPIARRLMVRYLARATLPGGGLFGSTEDLLRFGRSLLGAAGVPRLLSRAAIDRMMTLQTAGLLEQLEDGTTRMASYALGWGKPRPATDGPGVEVAGVTIPASEACVTHAGVSGTRLWLDPERGLVFVLLSNRWSGSLVPALEVLGAVYQGWPKDDRNGPAGALPVAAR